MIEILSVLLCELCVLCGYRWSLLPTAGDPYPSTISVAQLRIVSSTASSCFVKK